MDILKRTARAVIAAAFCGCALHASDPDDASITNRMDDALMTNELASPSLFLQADSPVESVEIEDGKKENYETLDKIARTSVPLFFVEKDGAFRLREPAEEGEAKTLVLSSGYLHAFGHYLMHGNFGTNTYPWPVLQMGIDWDSSTDEYRLDRLGIGLFGERLWLMHEMEQNEDEPGRYGIQLKQKW